MKTPTAPGRFQPTFDGTVGDTVMESFPVTQRAGHLACGDQPSVPKAIGLPLHIRVVDNGKQAMPAAAWPRPAGRRVACGEPVGRLYGRLPLAPGPRPAPRKAIDWIPSSAMATGKPTELACVCGLEQPAWPTNDLIRANRAATASQAAGRSHVQSASGNRLATSLIQLGLGPALPGISAAAVGAPQQPAKRWRWAIAAFGLDDRDAGRARSWPAHLRVAGGRNHPRRGGHSKSLPAPVGGKLRRLAILSTLARLYGQRLRRNRSCKSRSRNV